MFVGRFGIDLTIVEKVLTIPMHIPLGVALADFIEETGISLLSPTTTISTGSGSDSVVTIVCLVSQVDLTDLPRQRIMGFAPTGKARGIGLCQFVPSFSLDRCYA